MSSSLNNLPYNATWDEKIKYSFLQAIETCEVPDILYYAQPLPNIGITFHDLLVILSSVAMVFSCFISLYIVWGHYFHWVNPKEQKHIVVCVIYLPLFTIANFFAAWFYHSYSYITPILQLYNAKALTAVFLLYVAYVCPEKSLRNEFHNGLERRWASGKKRHDNGSLRWYRIIWVSVFQIVIFQLLLFPCYYILLQLTCPLESSRQTGTIVLEVVQYVTSTVCWSAIWVYHKRVRASLKEQRMSWKINAFQVLVGLQSTQTMVFPIVASSQGFWPTAYVSYFDFANAIPAFMLCWEALFCSLWFVKTFSFQQYRKTLLDTGVQPATVGRAFLDTIDQRDFLQGCALMFSILFGREPKKETISAMSEKAVGRHSSDPESVLLDQHESGAARLEHLNSK